MSIASTISLGDYTPKKQAKYLKLPKLRLEFDFNTDTGHQVTDEQVSKQVGKLAPKILGKHIKGRLQDIEKALAGVDKDIDAKRKKFFKEAGISSKAKTITPKQKKLLDAFTVKISQLVDNLQKYLQQIVDGINKSDSLKWVDEVYEASYAKLKKVISKYEFTRASGGRAKIIILAVITVAVIAVGIAATVASGGAAIVVIAGIAAGVLAIVAAGAKAGMAIAKSRGKLQRSIDKLSAQASEVERLTKLCDEVAKTTKSYDSNFKSKTGMSEKDYKKIFGTGRPDSEKLFPVLSGHKKTFTNFAKYLKDVEMLSVKINMAVRQILDNHGQVKQRSMQIIKSTKESSNPAELFAGKKGKALKTFVQNAPAILVDLDKKLISANADLKKVTDLVNANREIDKAFNKHKVVVSKIPGAKASIAKAEAVFETMDDVAGMLGDLSSALGDLT